MKEQGLFFTDEQRKLLEELQSLEDAAEIKRQLAIREVDQRKKLTITARMKIAENIQSNYSMLRNKRGIFNDQLFSAMEEYLKKCNDTGYELEGL